MSVRLGVLGCGGIARAAHLRSLARIPGGRVVALADTMAANLDAARPLAPDARAVAEYGDVLAMPEVDAVIIALPPALHASAAIAALDRGKHVYVEKPLATSVDDAGRVLDAARRSGLIAMMGFNYRHNPLVQRARSAIGGGAVGTPVGVRTVFTTPARAIPAWKQQRESGGGALLDLAVHHVDLIRFLLGTEVAHVSADVLSTRSEHDTVTLQMRLANGCLAQVMCSLGTIDDDRIEIHGSTGRLTIDRYRSLRVEVTPATASGMLGVAATRFAGEMRALPYALQKLRSPMHDPSFPAAIAAFVHAVASRTPAAPSFDDGLRALAVVEAAEESARSGRVIRLDSPAATFPRAHVQVSGV
jgi:myo-inositol 2-dehydrogenase / D-chiro-inositol 1-dehydrogenase